MNSFILRSSISQIIPALRRPRLIILRYPLARSVASSVSGRPGSQTLEHAATNVKEELGNSASDLAKVIAGANVTQDAIVNSSEDSFVGMKLHRTPYRERFFVFLAWNH